MPRPKKTAIKKPDAEPAAASDKEPDFKIIRTGKCQTITKKSTLSYNLSEGNDNKLYIQISNNSGGGFFSSEYISLDSITELIGGLSDITSLTLSELFVGKSVNTHSFLAAVLLKEGVLSPYPEKQFHYVFSGTEKLMENNDK